ncbi:hypothetical protein [Paracoccus aminophilus]|uniref:Glycosyltransferase RgtA/B/C/D-like domain-containing protein n=1 Tax=Paracoccus aminophilus JCM 7686 TaxID=1367847 RepID=S5XUK7_PARAH|nr:hypothetical protein [Paracoccus aminophilus]AGT11179.1 hypothetical protein JCM7686_pAMI5p113 [Paracoccus aminophilus JCM 7686]
MTAPSLASVRLTPRAATMARLLQILWIASAPLLCLLYLKQASSLDQLQFDYMGWMATKGQPFYAGSFDMNWPGAMYLHELAITVFGPRLWAWRVTDFVLMQIFALACCQFLRLCGFRLAPFVALALIAPLYVTAGGWMAGERDIIAVGFILSAFTALMSGPRRELWALTLAGALVACAVLIRPTYLSALVGILALELLPRRLIGKPRDRALWLRLLSICLGFGAVIAAVVALALRGGYLDDWYLFSVVFTSQVYAGEPAQAVIANLVMTLARAWHWMILCAGLGAMLWARRGRVARYPLALLGGLAAAIFLSYFVQNKGFTYHIAGLIYVLALLIAVGIDLLATEIRPPGTGARLAQIGLFGVLALTLLGTGMKIANNWHFLRDIPAHGLRPVASLYPGAEDDIAATVALIAANSTPEDRIVQYGTHYEIPFLAERLPASRFITPAIELMTPQFPLYDAWLAEMSADFARYRPKYILISQEELQSVDGGFASTDPGKPMLKTLLAFMAQDYEIVQTNPIGTLFVRHAP